jgi:hypothetical protein
VSKKHYQAIAAAIYRATQAVDHGFPDAEEHARAIALELSDVFKVDNPRFSRERFLEACETGKCRGMRQVER